MKNSIIFLCLTSTFAGKSPTSKQAQSMTMHTEHACIAYSRTPSLSSQTFQIILQSFYNHRPYLLAQDTIHDTTEQSEEFHHIYQSLLIFYRNFLLLSTRAFNLKACLWSHITQNPLKILQTRDSIRDTILMPVLEKDTSLDNRLADLYLQVTHTNNTIKSILATQSYKENTCISTTSDISMEMTEQDALSMIRTNNDMIYFIAQTILDNLHQIKQIDRSKYITPALIALCQKLNIQKYRIHIETFFSPQQGMRDMIILQKSITNNTQILYVLNKHIFSSESQSYFVDHVSRCYHTNIYAKHIFAIFIASSIDISNIGHISQCTAVTKITKALIHAMNIKIYCKEMLEGKALTYISSNLLQVKFPMIYALITSLHIVSIFIIQSQFVFRTVTGLNLEFIEPNLLNQAENELLNSIAQICSEDCTCYTLVYRECNNIKRYTIYDMLQFVYLIS